MDRLQPIYTETAACRDCYKCVRECPVKAIRVADGHASVLGELCVLCGHCVEVCPVGAKKVRSDVDRAKALVKLRSTTILSLAPSFASEFPGIESGQLVAALRALGFAAVSETALGADLVSQEAARELRGLSLAPATEPRVLISTACPVVVDYITKYRSELVPLLSRSCSPMVAHARFLKSIWREAAVVFAGPCVAKKREADSSGSENEGGVDAAITFRGLKAWLKAAGIDMGRAGEGIPLAEADRSPTAGPVVQAAASWPGAEERFVPERAAKGVLYPVDGGMIASIKHFAPKIEAHFVSCSGLVEIDRALDGIADYRGSVPIFLELLACEGGCVNGPRAERRSGSVAKRLSILEYAKGASGEAPSLLLSRGLSLAGRRGGGPVATERFPEERLREALRLVGKLGPEDELDCSGCGYDSCRAFAAAMLSGRAERTMCVSYTRDLAQKKADALVRAMPSGVVVVDSSLTIAECNANFAALLGPEAQAVYEAKPGMAGADLRKLAPFADLFASVLGEGGADHLDRDVKIGSRILHASVFAIEASTYAGGVFEDITVPWIRRDRVVAQAKSVIDKNLRTVQKIAYLLGENAADTEAILESLIESFSAEDHSGDAR